MEDYFVDHTAGVYPQFASGMPFTAATFSVTGDAIADIQEDMAAEQKARLTYDNILSGWPTIPMSSTRYVSSVNVRSYIINALVKV